MGRCWANSLGGCDAMSGEHVFSNSLFSAGCSCPTVVEGVPRIRNGAPTRNAEKANILCRRHNSMLSPLDETVGKIASFQAQTSDESFEKSLYVEGELLERWLLKTVINSAAAGWAGQRKWRPSPEIVSAIFGMSSIPDGLGLYSVDGIDPKHRPSGGVSFIPLIMKKPGDPQLIGAYITIHGMPLLAAFHVALAQRLEAGEAPSLSKRFSEAGLRHLYHPGVIVISRKRGSPAVLGLSWNGLLRFADGTTAPFPAP